MTIDATKSLLMKRAGLNMRLQNALAHLPLPHQISIITAWMSVKDLEDLVAAQERPT